MDAAASFRIIVTTLRDNNHPVSVLRINCDVANGFLLVRACDLLLTGASCAAPQSNAAVVAHRNLSYMGENSFAQVC